jgi:hypothetical protein
MFKTRKHTLFYTVQYNLYNTILHEIEKGSIKFLFRADNKVLHAVLRHRNEASSERKIYRVENYGVELVSTHVAYIRTLSRLFILPICT